MTPSDDRADLVRGEADLDLSQDSLELAQGRLTQAANSAVSIQVSIGFLQRLLTEVLRRRREELDLDDITILLIDEEIGAQLDSPDEDVDEIDELMEELDLSDEEVLNWDSLPWHPTRPTGEPTLGAPGTDTRRIRRDYKSPLIERGSTVERIQRRTAEMCDCQKTDWLRLAVWALILLFCAATWTLILHSIF